MKPPKLSRNIELTRGAIACYFGLAVEVIARMEYCSLIRYRNHEFIVSTEDLEDFLNTKLVALAAA